MDNSFLDELDRSILILLQQDATLTNQELAARVRKLVDLGVIERKVAIVSPEKVGAGLTGIVEITLDVQAAERLIEFEHLAAIEPAITQCYRVSTGPDFVLVVQVHDMAAYHALVHRAFTSQANVRNVRTFFSVHRSKFDTRVAL